MAWCTIEVKGAQGQALACGVVVCFYQLTRFVATAFGEGMHQYAAGGEAIDEVFVADNTVDGDFQASLLLARAAEAEVFGCCGNDHYARGGEERAVFSRVFGNVAVLRSSPSAEEDE
jgi:hypothetical protein